MAGVSVGTRMDGTVDVDIEDVRDGSWNTSNISLREAEFLHGELGAVIERQKARGFVTVKQKLTTGSDPERDQQ